MIATTPGDDIVWLTGKEAAPWLATAAAQLAADPASLSRLAATLRKSLTAGRVHLILEQVELRRRGKEKFAAAQRMFFSPLALMQATDEILAKYKARRFPTQGKLADLCCGIGGDLLALAERSECVGLEHDPALAHFAQRNCELLGRAGGRALVADAAMTPVHEYAAWHIDPDRRPTGKRTTRIELHEPPLDVLEELRMQNPNAAIKLAPATECSQAWKEASQREWLESRGECRQQVAWFGSLARHPGERSATIVDAPGGPRTVQGRGEGAVPVSERVGLFVFEPASAVLAAKLTHILCAQYSLASVSSQAMYLTGDTRLSDAALAGFEVLEVLPFDARKLKAWLRERNIGRLEMKKRGCEVDPQKLRKLLGGAGEDAATLLVCPLAGNFQVIVARRVSPP